MREEHCHGWHQSFLVGSGGINKRKMMKLEYFDISLCECLKDISMAVTKASQIKTETPVKETHRVVQTEDHNGNKIINECVREFKIGTGSYGKVVFHRNSKDGKCYAIKAFHKSLGFPNRE